VLVDHADAERARDDRCRDVALAAVDDDRAAVGPLRAGDALDERALAGAVLAEQRVHRSRRYLHRDAVQRREGAETLRQLDRLERERAGRRQDGIERRGHGRRFVAP
jgi:hypothetical protein